MIQPAVLSSAAAAASWMSKLRGFWPLDDGLRAVAAPPGAAIAKTGQWYAHVR